MKAPDKEPARIKQSPEMKIALLKAAIKFHKDMGFTDIVAIKERELAELERSAA